MLDKSLFFWITQSAAVLQVLFKNDSAHGCRLNYTIIPDDFEGFSLAQGCHYTDILPPYILIYHPEAEQLNIRDCIFVTLLLFYACIIMLQFWGDDVTSSSNIIFSNGDLDPWGPGGFHEDLSPTLLALQVVGGAHHLDLRQVYFNLGFTALFEIHCAYSTEDRMPWIHLQSSVFEKRRPALLVDGSMSFIRSCIALDRILRIFCDRSALDDHVLRSNLFVIFK